MLERRLWSFEKGKVGRVGGSLRPAAAHPIPPVAILLWSAVWSVIELEGCPLAVQVQHVISTGKIAKFKTLRMLSTEGRKNLGVQRGLE